MRFQNQTEDENFTPGYSNGAAVSDLDNDGDYDLVLNNINAPATILENQTNPLHFTEVKLRMEGLNSSAIGARILLHTKSQGVLNHQFVGVRGFQSTSSLKKVFAVNSTEIDSVEVLWPNGVRSVHRDIRDKNLLSPQQETPFVKKSLSNDSNPWIFTHQENTYYDYEQEPLVPQLISREGPCAIRGDWNNDGLEDLFVGGAHFQPSAIYMQFRWIVYFYTKSFFIRRTTLRRCGCRRF